MPGLSLLDPLAPEALRARVIDGARQALSRSDGRVVRAEVPVNGVAPLAWLAAQPAGWRFFWEGRGEAGAHAAAGETLVVEADDLGTVATALAPHLEALPEGARYYGYGRFEPQSPPDAAWGPFGRVRFVLPRFELRADGDTAFLAVHLNPGDDVEAVVDLLAVSEEAQPSALPSVRRREDAPGADGWHAAVTWALRQFEEGALDKVVLARRTRLFFDAPLDPFALLARLQPATPGCYHVLVGAGAGTFVSATPERLFRLEGQNVETEAVAGTRPRTGEEAADRRLHDALLGSEKDRREHAFVADAIAEALAPLTEHLDRDEALSTLTGAGVRHLYTRLRGLLRDGASALDVLAMLHPTPAVAGTPMAGAQAAIRTREPFDRGLYAGPVGWIGRDAAEFAVGIRSGLVHEGGLDLYSGAGIVTGSDPEAERAEIEHKLGAFLRVLGLGDDA